MSKLDYFQDGDEIAAEDGPPPFTQVPDWVLLSGCTAQAFRMYVFLAAHIDPRDPRGRVPCPKQTAIAKAMGLSNPKQVAPYGHELERLGALRIEKYRYASGMRNGYRYRVRFNPPDWYSGPIRMKDFYLANPGIRIDPAPGRLQVGALGSADGGTENSTSGGSENSTSRGARNSTPRRTTHGTPRGAVGGTAQGATDGTPQEVTGSPLEGASYGPPEGAADRSAKEDQGGVDQGGAETSPSSVGTAGERAGAGESDTQIGAASPRDLSPASPGGTAGASPTGGPRRGDDAPVSVEAGHVAMARDVVARLPRWVQPGDPVERTMAADVIAPYIAQGYPVAVLVRELSGNEPPEPIGAKPKFILARLRRMAPWVPSARAAAHTAAVDEIRERQAAQAGTPPPPAAADARAAMAAARQRGRTPKTQQQEAGGGTAAS